MKKPNWLVKDPPTAEDLLEALVGPAGRALPEKLGGLQELSRASPDDLAEHLTPVRVLRVQAAIRLHKTLSEEKVCHAGRIRCARDIFDLYRDRFEDQEHFIVLALDTKHRIKKEILVSKGSLSASIVHPREVFAPAIKERAAAVLVLHNHPSGDPAPSSEDVDITDRLKKTGELVGIRLLDHVIIGAGAYFSMAEEGRFT